MNWEAWLTLAVVALVIVGLVKEYLTPSALVFGGVVTLLVAGVIEPGQAFAGFANPAPITVAALYVLAASVEKTGLLAPLVDAGLGGSGSHRGALTRLLLPTAASSALLNNTPIVAMLVPPVSAWADRNKRSVSSLLMPLSFAAILGGTLTVIGTSTNLVVSGLMESHDLGAMGFFEIGKIGLPVLLVGLVVVIALAPKVLPNRTAARRDIEGDVRRFVVDMIVDAGGPLDGRTVSEGNLRHLEHVFLVQLVRGDRVVAPVAPTTMLQGGDRLRFVGKASEVVELHNARGLTPEPDEHMQGFDATQTGFFEAVVGAASPLAGRSLRQLGFRSRYQAAVVAIHRADQQVEGKLGDVRIRAGDTLLLLSDQGFRDRWGDRNDFLLVSRLGEAAPVRSSKAPIAAIVGIAVVGTAAFGVLDILEGALIGAFALVSFGVLTPSEARRSLDIDVLVVIAASFGLGAAIEETGLADRLASLVIDGFGSGGATLTLLGVVVATVALTELITNNAAAVLIFPIAISVALGVGADPRGYAIAVAMAASASFLTPIGYQTNTMVWGPGGYRFGDYARLGTPLTLAMIGGIVLMVPIFWSV